MSKKIMTKNTDKQAIDNLADNFNGYAALYGAQNETYIED